MDTILAGLIGGIHENPHDQLGYSILADRLEELGEKDKADAVRFVVHHQPNPDKMLAERGLHEDNYDDAWQGHNMSGSVLRSTFPDGVHVHNQRVQRGPMDHIAARFEPPTLRGVPGIDFIHGTHYIRLLHKDPTDKLIAAFDANGAGQGQPRSYHEAKKAGKGREWVLAHAALSQLAYHLTTFPRTTIGTNDAERGAALSKLLKSRGFLESHQRQSSGILAHNNTRRLHGVIQGDTLRHDSEPAPGVRLWKNGKRGAPTRLSREGEMPSIKEALMHAVAMGNHDALYPLADHLIESSDPHGEPLAASLLHGYVWLQGGHLYRVYGPETRDEGVEEGAFTHPNVPLTISYSGMRENSLPTVTDLRHLGDGATVAYLLKHKALHPLIRFLKHCGHPAGEELEKRLAAGKAPKWQSDADKSIRKGVYHLPPVSDRPEHILVANDGNESHRVQLSREPQQGYSSFAQALAIANSPSLQAKLKAIAHLLKVAEESGHAIPLIHHHPTRGFLPSVGAALTGPSVGPLPVIARYLGSWAGMLTQANSMLGFEPKDSGPDRLHVLESPDIQQLASALVSGGVRHFSLTPKAPYRAFVYDEGGQHDLNSIAKAANAKLVSTTGIGHPIGDSQSSPADARKHFRSTIDAVERHAGATSGSQAASGTSGS